MIKSLQKRDASSDEVNHEAIFMHLPTAAAVLHDRVIVACNERFIQMVRADRTTILGQSFAVLYADPQDFEERGKRVGAILKAKGDYSDERLLRRLDGDIFWTQISGHTFDRRSPFRRAVWTFIDLSEARDASGSQHPPLTQRERDVATLLLDQLSSKEIARRLAISPRTVDIHRSSLLRKYGVSATAELVVKLLRA